MTGKRYAVLIAAERNCRADRGWSVQPVDHRDCVVMIPESTKTSLQQRLSARVRDRWPQLPTVRVRYRAGFAYVDAAALLDGHTLRLCRLR